MHSKHLRRGQAVACALVYLSILVLPVASHAGVSKMPVNTSLLPLILRGEQVPALQGVSVISLSAFACNGDKPEALLFQVDELNEAGDYVPNTPTPDIPRDASPGTIDANDEVVMMVRDLGERCDESILSRLPGKAVEVRIDAPYLPSSGFVYFSISERGHVPSKGYVRYDFDRQRVVSDAQVMGYDPEQPFVLTEMSFADLSGRAGQDVLDRFKLRYRVKAMSSLVTVNVTEDDAEAKLIGVRAGPIRVIRVIDTRIAPVPGMAVNATVTYINYDRLFHGGGKFKLPGMVAAFTSSMDVSFSMDFYDLEGMRVSTKAMPNGVLVNGVMAQEEKAVALGDEPWYMASGLGLHMIGVVEVDKSLDLTAKTLFYDTHDAVHPPESKPGGVPELGYQFVGWENLQAREYKVLGTIATLPSFPEGGGSGFYNAFHAPVAVSSRSIGIQAAAQ